MTSFFIPLQQSDNALVVLLMYYIKCLLIINLTGLLYLPSISQRETPS